MNLCNHGIEKANGDIPVADCPDKLKENVDANPSDINSQVENNEKVPEMTENADADKDSENKPLTDDNGEKISDAPNHLAPNKTFSLNGIEYKTDDNGKVYCVDGELLANKEYTIDGHNYKTDDKGKIYQRDGKTNSNDTYFINGIRYDTDDNGLPYLIDGERIKPDSEIVINGDVYTTDNLGRVIHVKATFDNHAAAERDAKAELIAGGDDRKQTDHGGHIKARVFGGFSGLINIVAMHPRINLSDYGHMEDQISSAVNAGKTVSAEWDIHYDGDSRRPERIDVSVEIDGKKTEYQFDNNIDGILFDEVPEDGKAIVEVVQNARGGQISSIRRTYDQEGNLIMTEVFGVYQDENGKNQKWPPIVVENGD